MAKSLRFQGSTELRKLTAVVDRFDADTGSDVVSAEMTLSVLVEESVTKVLAQFFEDRGTVKALGGLLWRAKGELRETGLGGFALKGVYKGQSMTLATGATLAHLDDVTVRKVHILPFPGGSVSLRFEISAAVDGEQWAWLRDAMVLGAITVEFRAPRQRDPLDDMEHSNGGEEG